MTVTSIAELIERWNSDEGKPYKGSLIDYSAYKPGELGCMCAQGQVLHVVAGWSIDDLRATSQSAADLATGFNHVAVAKLVFGSAKDARPLCGAAHAACSPSNCGSLRSTSSRAMAM